MRGIHSNLVVTSQLDPATGIQKPLFAFPVQICKATEDIDVRFERADPNGFEVEQVYRSKGVGKEIYETADLIRGIRQGDSFSTISQDDIDAIDKATAIEAMTVTRSVPLDSIPTDRVVGSYYLQSPAKGGSQKHYELLRQALEGQAPKGKAKKGKPAFGLQVDFMTRKRQKLGVVFADEERACLRLVVLTYAEAVREPDEQILAPATHAEVDAKQVAMARKVVEGLASDEVTFNTPTDEAIALKRDLISKALDGEAIEAPTAPDAEAAPVASADELEGILEASLA